MCNTQSDIEREEIWFWNWLDSSILMYNRVPKRVFTLNALNKDLYLQSAEEQQVIADSVLPDDTCQTQDPVFTPNQVFHEPSHFQILQSITVHRVKRQS